MSTVAVLATPREQPPPQPANPARTLQEGIGKAMGMVNAPVDMFNEGFAKATAGLAKVWPSFPAATVGSLAVGLPHAHLPLPMVVLPVIGATLMGCCVSVLINGLPAARVGDIGLNPTCLGLPLPGFEIFTGSSKVFIGGARAARMFDITKHCWPPPPKWKAGAAMAKVVRGANAAMMGMMVAGMGAQVAGVVADSVDSADATDPAVAEGFALSAQMGAAQLAMDAAAMAMGMLMGKPPCIGSPTGAILLGAPNVVIGGFPVPSGMAALQRKLAGAELPPKKRGKLEENQQGNKTCR
ncbi:PAAR domain-containing protein [Nannocystis pusilla]|uniref:PAAR domain-containing protein n=1 Tax=Nannocystis pusilla TaxID=889268 RepID=A0A9X3F1V4_9BACT|nr:PAAR domain-containing protein [Nannocystis pusilla]MCY1013059.1 PAAR domain-containing protein [Nannocystis pusilla]